MGCNFSRVEGKNGAFLKRLHSVKARLPLKTDSTLSKKELLSHDEHVKISISSKENPYSLKDIIDNPNGIERTEIKIEAAPAVGIAIIIEAMKVNVANKEEAFSDDDFGEDNDNENDEANDDDDRMIGYPGSPSFRIYYKENSEDIHNEIDENDEAFNETDSAGDIIPPKKLPSHTEKNMKREKTKRCFRKALPKRGQAAVKSILHMKRGAHMRSSASYRVPSVIPN